MKPVHGWSHHRALVVLIAVFALGAVAFWQTAQAQKLALVEDVIELPLGIDPANPDGGPTKPGDFVGFNLVKDNQLKQRVEAAEDYINVGNWVKATEILQRLVEHPNDVMAQLKLRGPDGKPLAGPDGKPRLGWTNVKQEARRLMANLPREGMQYYQVTYGENAKELLAKAKEDGNAAILAEVMDRFLHTDAGAEATRLLASYHLDRGDWGSASRCFKRLLLRDGADKTSSIELFKAAYAFHLNGDTAEAETVWNELGVRGEVRMGEDIVSVTDLRSYVSTLSRRDRDLTQALYTMFGGGPNRSAKGKGDTAFMDPRWTVPMLASEGLARSWLNQAFEFLEQHGHPQLPAFFPVTANVLYRGEKTPTVIFRTHQHLAAYDVRTHQLLWRVPDPWSLESMLMDGKKNNSITNWFNFYSGQQRPSILFENSVVGSLSTDNVHVYQVLDFQIPPPPHVNANRARGQNTNLELPGSPMDQNGLRAWNASNGKLVWELPSHLEGAGDLEDSFFLGPPLPMGGKLYVLNEKQQDLRMLTLDPATGKVLRTQLLGSAKDKIDQSLHRRIHAAHLAYGEGMIIAPTNSGALLCIDMLTNSLVWAFPYREAPATAQLPQPGQPGFRPGIRAIPGGTNYKPGSYTSWKVSAPIIQNGQVVFTAPDSDEIHCVRLRDGEQLWKHARGDDDLYLAGVFNGKALVVGKRSCYALSLSSGKKVWEIPDTGLPSGYGVASDNIYYLPIKESPKGKEPEICAIDIERGVIHAHTKSRKKIVPGNLVFFDGAVISQSITDVHVFPQLTVKLKQIDELIAKNPNDPTGLTERGELRLDRGDLAGAVEDMRKALGQPSVPALVQERAKEKLYEALTEFFQRDYAAAEKHTDQYEALCTVEDPGETRKRKANFLCLVAKGKEKQRKLVEAFEKYQEFIAIAGEEELISVVDEPTVKASPDVWVQGRIAAMVAKATPEERKPLEERIAQEWHKLEKTSDLKELRQFVSLFGSLFSVGKEARLRLAERLLESAQDRTKADAHTALLDAERHLQLLRLQKEDRPLQARAILALADMYTRQRLLEEAAHYYGVLGRELADVVVQDGKTGADLFNELSTDKRLLGHLDQVQTFPQSATIQGSEERGSYPFQNQNNYYVFGQDGESLPFFRKHQLALQRNAPNHLRLLDRSSTGEGRSSDEEWSLPLNNAQSFFTLLNNRTVIQAGGPRFQFQTLGHLVVLQVGHMVYGIDPLHGKLLWEKDLFNANLLREDKAPANQVRNAISLTIDPISGSIQTMHQGGWIQRLGTAFSIKTGVVCLQTRDGMLAIDPVDGRTLWTRYDVSSRDVIFSDGEHLFIVEMSGSQAQDPVSTRALRAYDGVSINVKDFTDAHKNRARTLGRKILVKQEVADKGLVVSLYDIITGKDEWTETYPTGSKVLESEPAKLLGVMEPSGKLQIVDLEQGKRVMVTGVTPAHFRDTPTVYLLATDSEYFVVGAKPADASVIPSNGVITPALMTQAGMRSLPANGHVYAMDRRTGKTLWYYEMDHMALSMEYFDELPFLLFTANYHSFRPGAGIGRGNVPLTSVKAIHKRNGKYVFDNDSLPGKPPPLNPLPSNQTFHTFTVDPVAGKVELKAPQVKIIFDVRPGVVKAD